MHLSFGQCKELLTCWNHGISVPIAQQQHFRHGIICRSTSTYKYCTTKLYENLQQLSESRICRRPAFGRQFFCALLKDTKDIGYRMANLATTIRSSVAKLAHLSGKQVPAQALPNVVYSVANIQEQIKMEFPELFK